MIEAQTLLEGAIEVATQTLESRRFSWTDRTQAGAAQFLNSDLVQNYMSTFGSESDRLLRQRLRMGLSMISPHYGVRVSRFFTEPNGTSRLITTINRVFAREE